MKENEAPEKIWIDPTNDLSKLSGHIDEDSVEYIRKDVLIEKAATWLRTHSEGDYFELIPDANYCGAGNLNKKRMIDEFRKYMEGE